MKRKTYYLAIIITVLLSCKKELRHETSIPLNITEKQNSKILFSKVLAIAMEEEPKLRSFIKSEALKQFDRDNDVLFQMVKDEKVTLDQTFYQILSKYAKSKEGLDQAIEDLPTLTIMVPEFPNFTPTSWNSESEIPKIAISPNDKNFRSIEVYDSNGNIIEVPRGLIPGFPVVVIKENERINVSVGNVDHSPSSAILLNSSNSTENTFLTKDNRKFSFSNDAFNGISKTNLKVSYNNPIMSNSKTISRVDPTITFNDGTTKKSANPIDPLVIQAFENNLDWQRDFVYYGLNPTAGKDKGKFNNRIVEHIVSIRMKDSNINRISDQTNDPLPTGQDFNIAGAPSPLSEWTDGYFDIRIAVLINAKNGAGTQLNKVITAKGSDLYNITYEVTSGPRGYLYYKYKGIAPKDYFINEPLVAWNLENYGAAWKFIVSEYDPSEEIITTHTESTKFAANFGYDIGFGETVKVGYKFGASIETTSSSSFQYKTTRSSDELGEGIIEFGAPIILRKEVVTPTPSTTPPRNPTPGRTDNIAFTTNYITNEVSCGTIYLSIEPKQI
ncbi:hypothetical protein [Pedobacter nototheniae]|uniref:hypothetical protein n=1 Tax=Pedobacter nototheniae TaxID=2488994 RepID=UPI0029309BC5|nr:hypothetical protein [Pedobacter nototheniae]